jgi:hypothetical protein
MDVSRRESIRYDISGLSEHEMHVLMRSLSGRTLKPADAATAKAMHDQLTVLITPPSRLDPNDVPETIGRLGPPV